MFGQPEEFAGVFRIVRTVWIITGAGSRRHERRRDGILAGHELQRVRLVTTRRRWESALSSVNDEIPLENPDYWLS